MGLYGGPQKRTTTQLPVSQLKWIIIQNMSTPLDIY